MLLAFSCKSGGLYARFKARKENALGFLVYQRTSTQARWDAMAVGRRDRHSKNALHGHRVAAVAPIMEEMTGAVPLAIIVVSSVNIIFAPKCRFKACELNAFGFFRVAFGFSNLVDHA